MKPMIDKRLRLFQRPQVELTLLSSKSPMINTKEYGELIDMESGCWAAVLGHSKNVLQEVIESLEYPVHTNQFFDSPLSSQLIKKLECCAGLPLSYVGTFMTSGTEAVSLAIMLSEVLTGRSKKLSLSISYLGASPDLRFPRDPNKWTDFNPLDCLSCPDNKNCECCTKFASFDFTQYAAFILEPGNSGGIIIFPPEKLINFLSYQIKSSGGMLIANEVTTGIGRTGRFFGYQHYSMLNAPMLSPDFIAIGKCLGNGYPVSAVLTNASYQCELEASGFRYVQSHSDDPLGLAVALKTIDIIQSKQLVEKALEKGEFLKNLLNNSKGINNIRGKGLMNVIEFQKPLNVKTIFDALLKEGFFTGYSEAHQLIRLYPPLTISKETIASFCIALKKIILI